MGEIADDILEGFQCSHCGICFEKPHDYPVLCEECFGEDSGKSGIQESTNNEVDYRRYKYMIGKE